MKKPFNLLLFDFFNTLVLPEPSQLPRLLVEGRQAVTTAGLLHRRLRGRFPDLESSRVYHALEKAGRRVERQRGDEQKERPALERFKLLVEELGLEGAGAELPVELMLCHMEALRRSFILPAAHVSLLEKLKGEFRLAIFSNCDYPPVIREILALNGLLEWFDPVIVSEEIGYRKPGRAAFDRALELTGEPAGRILFIGDSLEHDVAGARGCKLEVAWIQPQGKGATSKGAKAQSQPEHTAGTGATSCPLMNI